MNNTANIEINDYLKELEEKREFSGAVLVAKGDSVLLKESYGLANHDLDVPNTLKTRFCIASITKSITAMAVMILAQENKLSLDDTLDKYIVDHPYGDMITIHHLLTHTSGLVFLYNDPEYKSFISEDNTIEEQIHKFKERPLGSTPGEKFEYSNMGYSILSYIIEKVSNKPYDDFIKKNIFDKLSMKDTGCFRNENILRNKASGYSRVDGNIINCQNTNFSAFTGAGDLYSTVEDLYTWTNALLKSDLLDSEYNEKLLIDYGKLYDEFYYGYGKIMAKKDNKVKYFYQDGGLPGYKSIYLVYPDKDVTVIILSNYDFINMVDILNKIEEVIYDSQPTFKID